MTQTNFVNPTYYNLQKATIRSQFSNLNNLDVTMLIPNISITSSIDSDTMHGIAKFVDSAGLLEETPLRGEEQIIFELADSKMINESGGLQGSLVDEPFIFTGFIYKIDNVTSKDANDSISYDVHFVSYQSFIAGTKQITRSFRDQKVSDISNTIFREYYMNPSQGFLDNAKDLISEQTDGIIRCVIPRLRPEEAMDFLCKRAYSANESPSCTFRFFESSKGYHFVTDEQLFRLADEENSDRLFKFTYLDAIPNTLDYFDEQLNNLEILENTNRINSLSDLYNGAYKNKVLELDILTRRTNLLDDSGQYDYFSNRRRYFDVRRDQTISDRHTVRFIQETNPTSETRDESIQKKFTIVRTFTSDQNSSTAFSLPAETYYADIISNRQAYSKHIESITVDAVGPGRFDISAGDIIELDVKKFQFASGNQMNDIEQNKHLSGRYIVKSVSHVMNADQMRNVYKLIKKDWSEIITLSNTNGIGPI